MCWSRYQTVAELVRDRVLATNPLFQRVEQPGVGEMLAAGIPLNFGAVPRVPAQAAPRLGEHTEEVLAQLLGIDAAQFGRLHDRGVVRQGG